MSTKKKQYDYAELANKFTLTFEEAQTYFHIGEKKLRKLINDNDSADWVLWCGNRHYVKRQLFEKYLSEVHNL